jgi:hydroxymethylbilane synthase
VRQGRSRNGTIRGERHVERIVIGTRGSALALAQTELVAKQLALVHPHLSVDVTIIKTEGDRKQGTPLAAQSDKKDWIIDLERALLAGEIDVAIHSGKDVPGEIESGTEICSILERATPYDAFVGKRQPSGERLSFANLPHGAIVGTASLRRKASLRAYRDDIALRDHRGNVPTRIKKLDESSELAGIILAAAGLERLGLSDLQYEILPRDIMLPAMNQGALAAQIRAGDARVLKIVSSIADAETAAEFVAERAVAEVLGGDCHSAISIFAEARGEEISVECRVFETEGHRCISYSTSGRSTNAAKLGTQVGQEILTRGGADILK